MIRQRKYWFVRRIRRILGPLMVMCAGVVSALVISEMGLRWYGFRESAFVSRALQIEYLRSTRSNADWGWSFVPSIDTMWDYTGRERAENLVRFKTIPIPNYPSVGMRDTPPRPDATQIIPVLGDSFTFGATVNQEQIWTSRIEFAHPEVELLNLASGGGIVHAERQYAALRDKLPPHSVVIYALWVGNEFLDNLVEASIQKYDSNENEIDRIPLLVRSISMSRVGYLLELLLSQVESVISNKAHRDGKYFAEKDQFWSEEWGNFYLAPRNLIGLQYCRSSYADPQIEKGIAETRASMERLKRLAGDRTVVLVLFPFKEQLYFDAIHPRPDGMEPLKPNRIIMDLCRETGINCFDAFDELTKMKHLKLFWDYDPHFTPTGQQAAADATYGYLLDHGFFKSDQHSNQ